MQNWIAILPAEKYLIYHIFSLHVVKRWQRKVDLTGTRTRDLLITVPVPVQSSFLCHFFSNSLKVPSHFFPLFVLCFLSNKWKRILDTKNYRRKPWKFVWYKRTSLHPLMISSLQILAFPQYSTNQYFYRFFFSRTLMAWLSWPQDFAS